MADSPDAEEVARRQRLARADARYNMIMDVFILLLSGGVILASIVLSPHPDAVAIMGVKIPSTCVFYNLTGHECLGCGLTRSFTYMGHAQLLQAFSMHMLGPVLYLFTVFQVPYRVVRLWRRARPSRSAGPGSSLG